MEINQSVAVTDDPKSCPGATLLYIDTRNKCGLVMFNPIPFCGLCMAIFLRFRYLSCVPLEAEGLESFQSSGFGTWLWCSLSIIVNGDECYQNQLWLGIEVATPCHLKEFTKQVGKICTV